MIVAREEGRMLQEQLLKKQKKVTYIINYNIIFYSYCISKIAVVFINHFLYYFRKLIEDYVRHRYIQQMGTVHTLSY